jgi:hypothetical protein
VGVRSRVSGGQAPEAEHHQREDEEGWQRSRAGREVAVPTGEAIVGLESE